jgi:hypothetical protein
MLGIMSRSSFVQCGTMFKVRDRAMQGVAACFSILKSQHEVIVAMSD